MGVFFFFYFPSFFLPIHALHLDAGVARISITIITFFKHFIYSNYSLLDNVISTRFSHCSVKPLLHVVHIEGRLV